MRPNPIVLAATFFAAISGFVSQASAQSCLAVSVRGGVFSCPGCLSPGAMPLQCSVHQCGSPAPAVDGWVGFSSGFPDFAAAGAVCATLGVPGWAAFAPPPPAPPVVPVVAPVAPPVVVAPSPLITTSPVGPRIVIGSKPGPTKTTVVVVKKKPPHVVKQQPHVIKQPKIYVNKQPKVHIKQVQQKPLVVVQKKKHQ